MTNDQIEIVALPPTKGGVARFLQVPYPIYQDDPHWVAPLLSDLEKVFLLGNPFLDHAEMQLWVAVRGGRDVGRIAGIVDHHHNQGKTATEAFFGFFESVQDRAVSRALFQQVYAWAKGKGHQRVLGPMNPSTNDECGLVVQGLNERPVFMMPYNPAYYIDLVEAEGFRKAKDLLAFYIDLKDCPMERLGRLAEKVRKRNPDLSFRAVTKRSLANDLGKVKDVYNAAWEANWGFVPMTDAEISFLAERLKPLLTEGLVWLAETATEPVAFLLAVTDFNEAIQPLRGRLLTPRLLGFIPYLLGWKVPSISRVITLGVKTSHRGRGLEAVMLYEGLKVGFKLGFKGSDASWVLEDNVPMRREMELFSGKVYRTYRLYERAI